MTVERQGKGMDKEKGVQQVHRDRHKLSVTWRRSVYGASLRVGNAAVPGTHIMSIRVSVADIGDIGIYQGRQKRRHVW